MQKECSVPGKALYQVWRTNFEIDTKYQPIKAIGKGAYGVVCSAKNEETGRWTGGCMGAGQRQVLTYSASRDYVIPPWREECT